MSKFKAGDRVVCVEQQDGNDDVVGKVGKVMHRSIDYCVVEFDVPVNGHSGFLGKGKSGHCWDIYERKLIPYSNVTDHMVVNGQLHKIVKKISIKQKKHLSRPATQYYAISTVYRLLPKGDKRRFMVVATDRKYKTCVGSYNPFLSVLAAEKYIEALQ